MIVYVTRLHEPNASATPTPRWVLLPGTGSDARFIRDAFATAVNGGAESGANLVAVEPDPSALINSYLGALSKAATEPGSLVTGGVSIGAAVAARWVIDNPGRCDGLLLALPAWTGPPLHAPASVSARFTAACLRADGLDRTIATMSESSPAWLAETLERSWRDQWPLLPLALEEAAAYVAPTAAELATITVPTVVVVAENDPIHPAAVGREWAQAIRGATLLTVDLADLARDVTVIGELVRESGLLHPH